MLPLLLSVGLVVGLSFICSVTEASLYSVSPTYVRKLAQSRPGVSRLLERFKRKVDEPISAILILNTAANAGGAVIAGALAIELWGHRALPWFSVIFTLIVLFVGEIVPKVIGVVHNRGVARTLARPLMGLIWVFYPLIAVCRAFSQLLAGGRRVLHAPEDELLMMAQLGAEEGSILPIESQLIRNVLALDRVRVGEIMTPRTVLVRARAESSIKDVGDEAMRWPHSRVPIYAKDDPENVTGLVLRREVVDRLARGEHELTLQDLAQPIHFVPEQMRGDQLLAELLRRRAHLVGVVDEYGGLAGIVTLEDALEALIGQEIVDESDTVADLQAYARLLAARRPHGTRPKKQ
jgi:CBS domain containing-hemolysin-like protein